MAEKIVVDIEFQTNVKKISKDLESVKDALSETNENLEDIAKTGKNTEGALKKVGKLEILLIIIKEIQVILILFFGKTTNNKNTMVIALTYSLKML